VVPVAALSRNATDQWKELSNGAWHAREGLMVESFKGDLILTGGRSTGGISFANDVWRSSDGSSWSRVTKSAPWGERAYHILVTGSDGCLILMGGQTFSKTYNDVWK